MKITAQDLAELKVIDETIAEPIGGAHREPAAAIAKVGAAIAAALDDLAALSPAELRQQRRERFLAIGRFDAENAPSV
jgi:acetyl-CoA carboxylase carboxyl transferase subunit alpha